MLRRGLVIKYKQKATTTSHERHVADLDGRKKGLGSGTDQVKTEISPKPHCSQIENH